MSEELCCEAEAPILFDTSVDLFGDAPILFDADDQPHTSRASIHPTTILAPLTYNLYWFDLNYPHSQHDGDQRDLKLKFVGIPLKILNNLAAATLELNTTLANTRFILVMSGPKKKELLKNVHNCPGIESILVLKQFSKLNASQYPKIKLIPSYDALLVQLRTMLFSPAALPKAGVRLEDRKVVDFRILADPVVMCEQCTKSLEYELQIQKNQRKSRQKTLLAMMLLLNYFREAQSKAKNDSDSDVIDNPLYNGLKSQSLLPSAATLGSTLRTLIDILQIGIAFDSTRVIIAPNSIKATEKLLKKNPAVNLDSLGSEAAHVLGEIKSGKIFRPESSQNLRQFHAQILLCIQQFQKNKNAVGWERLHLSAMLLSDCDLCVKLFLELIFSADRNFASFADSFTRANMVSDHRVSVMKEIWVRSQFREDPAFFKQFTPQEMQVANEHCGVGRMAVFCGCPEMDTLAKAINEQFGKKLRIESYVFAHEFEMECAKGPIYAKVYLVISAGTRRCDFSKLLDCCVKVSITPIFVIYSPQNEGEERWISKDMLRGNWTQMTVYCETIEQVVNYLENREKDVRHELQYCRDYYANFKRTLSLVRRDGKAAAAKSALTASNPDERDGGWELLSSIDPSIFSGLIEERVLGSKISGSLHFHMYNYFKSIHKEKDYWGNYASLFGACDRCVSALEVEVAKRMLKAYTLQTVPGFYKLMNDAFRSGNPDKIGEYRTFYGSLTTMVKSDLLKKYIGTVYRGTYFNPELLSTLKTGTRMYSSCFTSTSKSYHVALNFARKTRRNVLLEIALDSTAYSNVDIHSENCSAFPEEYEVLLLPFACFEITSVFVEDGFTTISLKEQNTDIGLANLTTVDYYA